MNWEIESGPSRVVSPHAGTNALWLIKLRWVAVAGQTLTILAVQYLWQIPIELPWLLVAVALAAATNLLLMVWYRIRLAEPASQETLPAESRLVLGGVMLLDLLLLTTMLYLTGGPYNPFSVFYFVNLSLAALLVPGRWAWLLTVTAVVCYGLLFFDHLQIESLNRQAEPAPGAPAGLPEDGGRVRGIRWPSTRDVGMLIAFTTCASVVVYFMTRVTAELSRRERELRLAEALRARAEKLQALGTLAAGAAHELASPLSTIAVVAKEVEHAVRSRGETELIDDVALIRSELDRCRAILDRMAAEAGHSAGERVTTVRVADLVESVLDCLANRQQVDVSLPEEVGDLQLQTQPKVLGQAIRGLLKNALDASSAQHHVQWRLARQKNLLLAEISDRGMGMPHAVLDRVGEPFFSTKEPGQGMGLGVFLARSVVERLGGSLAFHSQPGEGTTVELRLPLPG